ncbi:MAG: hypothetical protein PQJ46_03015, partial [Spirochaetales bacterium]|nr:hypothetical protein [Spirochaetales bacterium]
MIITVINRTHRSRVFSTRIFLTLCWSILLVMFFDSCAWIFDGLEGTLYRRLNYVSNFLLFFFQPLPLTIWLYYADFLLNNSAQRLKRRWYYFLPFIIVATVTVISLFNGKIFYIDEQNIYYRGSWFVYLSFFYAFPILVPFIF